MKSDWSMRDVPIGKYDVRTEANPVTGEIKQITEIAGKITEEIIRTKSDQLRNALVDLGWTPPEGKEHKPESKLPEGFQDDFVPKVAECMFRGIPIAEYPLFDVLAITAYMFEQKVHIPRHFRHEKVVEKLIEQHMPGKTRWEKGYNSGLETAESVVRSDAL